jgi:hypothetical protein
LEPKREPWDGSGNWKKKGRPIKNEMPAAETVLDDSSGKLVTSEALWQRAM